MLSFVPPAPNTSTGLQCLSDPLINKGTAYTRDERVRLRLEGLLPPRVETLQEQATRVIENMRGKNSALEKYRYLSAVQGDNETLFYRVVRDHLEETLPIIYTPTVGQGQGLADQRILFVGAGEACLGIGGLVVAAMQREGLSEGSARERCLFIDSKGAVIASRTDLPEQKRPFAQDRAPMPDLLASVEDFKPTVLIGACGQTRCLRKWQPLRPRDVCRARAFAWAGEQFQYLPWRGPRAAAVRRETGHG